MPKVIKRDRDFEIQQLDNGLFQYTNRAGLCYPDSNGVWQLSNAKVKASKVSGFGYDCDEIEFPIRFAKKANGAQRIEDRKGHSVSYTAVDAAAANGIIEGEQVRYANAWPNADLIMRSSPEGLRKEIILKAKQNKSVWSFKVDKVKTKTASKGAKIEVEDAETNEFLWAVQEPFAVDAAGDYIAGTLTERVSGGATYFDVAIDAAWLEKAVYPVTIDPTTTITSSDIDSYLSQANPNSNYSNVIMRLDSYIGGSGTRKRYLLRFTGLPAKAAVSSVTSANLYLRQVGSDNAVKGKQVSVFYLKHHAWTETGVTWNNYASGAAWANAGVWTGTTADDNEIPGAVSTYNSINGETGDINIDVKSHVEYMYASDAGAEISAGGNYRINFFGKFTAEDGTNGLTAYDQTYGHDGSIAAERPQLTIVYAYNETVDLNGTFGTASASGIAPAVKVNVKAVAPIGTASAEGIAPAVYSSVADAASAASAQAEGVTGEDLITYVEDAQAAAGTAQGGSAVEDLITRIETQEGAAAAVAEGGEGTEFATYFETVEEPAAAQAAGGQSEDLATFIDAAASGTATAQGGVIDEFVARADEAASAAAIAAGGTGADLITRIDTASAASAQAAGGANSEAVTRVDTASAASAVAAGGSSSDAIARVDTAGAANAQAAGGATAETASFFDNVNAGAAAQAAGGEGTDLATFVESADAADAVAEGGEGEEQITRVDTAGAASAQAAGSSVDDVVFGTDIVEAAAAIAAGSNIAEVATRIDTAAAAAANAEGGSLAEQVTYNRVSLRPFAIALYSTENGLPLTVLDAFNAIDYRQAANEAGRVTVSFPADAPANKLIRDIYTGEPHGVFGVLYRHGAPVCGLVLAETDITRSPVAWQFLTFESKLRAFRTPANYHGCENVAISDAIASLAEKGFKWYHRNSEADLQGAALADVAFKTWYQLSGGSEGYNAPMLVLRRVSDDDTKAYKATGTAVFDFDFGSPIELERLRWRQSTGEYTHVGMEFRTSNDAVTWTAWADKVEIADDDYAEGYGVALAGTKRYLQARFTLRTEDVTSKDKNGNAVGTTPALFGLEVITRHSTGIDAFSIATEGEILPVGYDFEHENAFAAIAAICADYGYKFRVDYLNRLYVWRSASSAPYVVKAGETAEPRVIAYTGIDDIQNAITLYGAGEGLGRLSVTVEDAESIAIYGRRPGIITDGKINTVAELQTRAQNELLDRAWPRLECELSAPYTSGVAALDANVGEYLAFFNGDVFEGEETAGSRVFEITDISRSYSESGETVTFGLNSSLDNLFTRQSKADVKKRYKQGKMLAQIPFDVRATGAFASVVLTWHGAADEYIIESASAAEGPFAAIGRTANASYVHSGLATGATLWYRIRAVYGSAISGASEPVTATTELITSGDIDTTPPAVPTGLNVATATAQGAAGAVIILNTATWNANVETDLAHYELKRRIAAGTWQSVGVIAAGITTFIDTAGLQENTEYEYAIAAIDRVGNRSDWSSGVSVTTAKDATAPSLPASAPVITAGFKRLAIRWQGTTAADLAYYKLQRETATATFNSTTGLYEVPATPAGGGWIDVAGAAIRALSYQDAEVEFANCYRYRVAAVDTSGNVSAFTPASSWAVCSKVGAADAAFGFITAEMYGEIRNVMPYTGRQEIDASYPIEIPFYIPSETTGIVSIKLSAYAMRFRATSKAATAGGSHSHSVTIPGHTHGILHSTVSDGVLTGSAGSHSHGVSGDADSAGSHSHEVVGGTDTVEGHSHGVEGTTYFDGTHSHNVSGGTDTESAHQHSAWFMVSGDLTESGGGTTPTSAAAGEHDHDIDYGIYESGTPATVKLYVDNGAGYGSAINLASAPDAATPYPLATEYELSAAITTPGWKKLKFTSSRLGAIEYQIIAKIDVTA